MLTMLIFTVIYLLVKNSSTRQLEKIVFTLTFK